MVEMSRHKFHSSGDVKNLEKKNNGYFTYLLIFSLKQILIYVPNWHPVLLIYKIITNDDFQDSTKFMSRYTYYNNSEIGDDI